MTNDKFFQEKLLLRFDKLLHRVLRDLYLHPTNKDYDDYYQELSLKLLKIVKTFKGDPLGEDRYLFTAYAKRGLQWYLLDMIRSDKYEKNETPLSDVIYEESHTSPMTTDNISFRLKLFLKEAFELLNPKERQLLDFFSSGDYTLTEISKLIGVSRKTISVRKRSLKEKLIHLKSILKD